jgi:hypothetical protein
MLCNYSTQKNILENREEGVNGDNGEQKRAIS